MFLQICRLLIVSLWLCAGLSSASAQLYHGKKIVNASLVADTTAVAPGQPFYVGLLLQIEPNWHTYWQYPGEGLAMSGATSLHWNLPPGFKAGDIEWPIPESFLFAKSLLTYIYENQVLLMVRITPPADLPPGNTVLSAKAQWVVCEANCLSGNGDVSLTLPAGTPEPSNADLFKAWRDKLPKSGPPPFKTEWKSAADAVTLKITGLPKTKDAEFLPIPPTPEVQLGRPAVSEVADDGSRTFTVPVSDGGSPDLQWSGLVVIKENGQSPEGWMVAMNASEKPAPKATPENAAINPTKSPAPAAVGTGNVSKAANSLTFFGALGGAFLGGLILNLMPCVLPVIALKIFGFLNQANEDPHRVFQLGLAFVGGVFAFFLLIAFLVIGLHSFGKRFNFGFQFQNGFLLVTLIALVFIFALSMFGVFEVTLGGGTATKLYQLSSKQGAGGAFVHGLFTTLLGTSCTAPFLGPVLGFAIVQSAPVVIAIFLSIAAGMSLPYFLLTWKPAWMKFLPKPGAWMEKVKQFMGFALLAVVLWLLGIVGQGRGVDAMTSVSCFLLLLGLACWIYGNVRRAAVAWPIVILLVGGGWFFFVQNSINAAPATAAATTGSVTERIDAALKTGHPVFVDFTAEWCLNCKYNEKFVLGSHPIETAFREKKVQMIRADWTNYDPEITKLLEKFGRAGVPVYVLYPGREQEPLVLPEILTQSNLMEALQKIPAETQNVSSE